MSRTADKESAGIKGVSKGAVLLLSLGYEQSAALLKLLSDEQVQTISEEIASLGEVTTEQTDSVLEEFIRLSGYDANTTSGGFGRAHRMLSTAFGQEAAKKMAETLAQPQRDHLPNMTSIVRADPERLANLLSGEHPQTIAVLLAHLPADKSSTLLHSLPEELRVDVAFRLASLDGTYPEIVSRIVTVLDQKLNAVGGPSRHTIGGLHVVAELLNRAEPEVAEKILARMEEKDEATANQVRKLLFVFEDLLNVDAKGLKELMKQIDRKQLTMALKGTTDELRAHIFGTMSKSAAEMMREDMEALGPVRIKDVESAQGELLDLARSLEKEGVLSLSSAEAEYVV